MCRSGRSTRTLVSSLACLFCIGLLVAVVRDSGARKDGTPVVAAAAVGSSRASPTRQMNLDPFHASKRRVPNGPDPIHNRRARKSSRPPGRD